MIVKKFIADSMNEALTQVKRELGEDAVILQSRKVEKGGVLSFLGKEMVEVTAATPDHNPPPPPRRTDLNPRQREALLLATEETPPRLAQRRQSLDAADLSPASDDLKNLELRMVRDELSELRASVHEMANHLKYNGAPVLPDSLGTVWRAMIDNGVSHRIATDICQRLLHDVGVEELTNSNVLYEALLKAISNRISTGKISVESHPGKPFSIALIGPTGVGKTTTIAKLATNRKIFGGKQVGLISTDTYRIAAVEQLKTFASIASLEISIVYQPSDLRRSIEGFTDKDIVLIDTAGRSQNDHDAMSELQDFIDSGTPDEVVLVLSAGTRIEDQREMIRRFSKIAVTKVILTKIDEVTSAGHLLDLAELVPKKWIYLTTGQSVPDDIIPAEAKKISSLIPRREDFEKQRRTGFAARTPGRINH